MKHRPELDGLRALAIFIVVLTHAYIRIFPGGWIGVDLFFVLSGFLITGILTRELETSGSIALGRFYLRRSLRLYPALLLMLAAVAVIEFGFKTVPSIDSGRSIIMAATYVMNWFKAFDLVTPGILGHTWSLAIEEQFYLLWPLVLLIIPSPIRLRVTLGLLSLVVGWKLIMISGGASAERIYFGFDTRCDSLLIGCCLAQIKISPAWSRNLARAWVIPVVILGVLVVALEYERGIAMTSGVLVVGLCGAWLVIGSQHPGRLQSLLAHRAPVFIGQISYGIYLWHDPLLFYLHHVFPPALAIIPALLAVPIAALSYRLVEQPILRWRDRRLAMNSIARA